MFFSFLFGPKRYPSRGNTQYCTVTHSHGTQGEIAGFFSRTLFCDVDFMDASIQKLHFMEQEDLVRPLRIVVSYAMIYSFSSAFVSGLKFECVLL